MRKLAKIDQSCVGRRRPPTSIRVEAPQLRMFLRSIGEDAPTFRDSAVARAQGYRDIPIPATYLFCLHMLSAEDLFELYRDMGIDIGRLLHGEQSFSYYAQICVGDELTFEAEVSDVADKKSGEMTLVTQTVKVRNQDGQHVADMTLNTIVLNSAPEEAA